MGKLYDKNPLTFALVWIGIYIVGSSAAENIDAALGTTKLVCLLFHLGLSVYALIWLKKKGLFKYFGLCAPNCGASRFIWYIPLVLISSCNMWFGLEMRMDVPGSLAYVGSMLCVGFLEELIFRGFLFKAMSRDGIKAAIIVSSITFGIGHIINLFNGSGAGLVATLCQICYACVMGLMFVLIFHRGGTILPCIATHSIINGMSAFASEVSETPVNIILSSVILCLMSAAYCAVLMKTLPGAKATESNT